MVQFQHGPDENGNETGNRVGQEFEAAAQGPEFTDKKAGAEGNQRHTEDGEPPGKEEGKDRESEQRPQKEAFFPVPPDKQDQSAKGGHEGQEITAGDGHHAFEGGSHLFADRDPDVGERAGDFLADVAELGLEHAEEAPDGAHALPEEQEQQAQPEATQKDPTFAGRGAIIEYQGYSQGNEADGGDHVRGLVPPPKEQTVGEHPHGKVNIAPATRRQAELEKETGGAGRQGYVEAIRVEPPEPAAIDIIGRQQSYQGSDGPGQRPPEEFPQAIEGQNDQHSQDGRQQHGHPVDGKRKEAGDARGQHGDEGRRLGSRRVVRHRSFLVQGMVGPFHQVAGEGEVEKTVESCQQRFALVEGPSRLLLPGDQIFEAHPQAQRHHQDECQDLKPAPFARAHQGFFRSRLRLRQRAKLSLRVRPAALLRNRRGRLGRSGWAGFRVRYPASLLHGVP